MNEANEMAQLEARRVAWHRVLVKVDELLNDDC
jgi:hypothetical protein